MLINYVCKFKGVIHEKDNDQRDLQKQLSEIRRECENVRKEVK